MPSACCRSRPLQARISPQPLLDGPCTTPGDHDIDDHDNDDHDHHHDEDDDDDDDVDPPPTSVPSRAVFQKELAAQLGGRT